MIYWQLINSGNNKLDIFAKSYTEQLVWYYTQFIGDMAIRLPASEQTIVEALTQQYPNLSVNQALARHNTDCCDVVLDANYVIKKPLRLVESLNLTKAADAVYLYRQKKSVVAVLLPSGLRAQLAERDRCFDNYDLQFADLLKLISESKLPVIELKIKKRHIICVNESGAAVRFMAWLNNIKQHQLGRDGVLIWDKKSTWIEPTVQVGRGTQIYPGSLLRGNTVVGKNCTIGPAARITDSRVGNAVSVVDSTVISSAIDDQTKVGPYAYLRPNSDIGKDVKIGDFVEVKNARIDDGSKVSHLSYIGDGFVGKRVNIGCGTVFVNYDGVNKHKTIVEDDCFIGCNTNLVAPVTVKKSAYVAAGSTITDDVQSGDLAIARARQVVKPDWAKDWVKNQKKANR